MVLLAAERHAAEAGLTGGILPPDHWRDIAALWSRFGPPLRPVAEDVGLLTRHLPPGPARVLVLGVTPELLGFPWDPGSPVVSVDRSPEVAEALAPGRRVVVADWLRMPFEDASFDFVVGDGCNPSLGSREALHEWLTEIARVLAPGGRFAHRYFVRPFSPGLERDCLGPAGFHAIKIRLAAFIASSNQGVVRLGDVYDAFPANLGRWTKDELSTLEPYRGSDVRYYLPTEDQIRHPDLVRVAADCPSYGLGHMFPVVVHEHS